MIKICSEIILKEGIENLYEPEVTHYNKTVFSGYNRAMVQ